MAVAGNYCCSYLPIALVKAIKRGYSAIRSFIRRVVPSVFIDYSNWMSGLPTRLHNIPINGLAIPGSHDTASSYIKEDSEIAPDCGILVEDLVKLFGEEAKKFIYNWHHNQTLSITEQLCSGIRYFDLRTAYRQADDCFYFCHAMFANKVCEGMKELDTFLNAHKREIVLLDFNHFYSMDRTRHSRLKQLITAMFGSKICPVMNVSGATLSHLWTAGYQVLIFYHEKSTNSSDLFWSGDKIPSPWPNTTSVKNMMGFLEERYEEGRDPTKFYVTQGLLTPSIEFLLVHLGSNLKKSMSIPADKAMVPWMREKHAGPTKFNVAIIDYVELYDYIPTVVALNYR